MKINLNDIFRNGMSLIKAHMPEILVISGVTGCVAGGVMGCIATTKLNGVMEDHKTRIEKIGKKNVRTYGKTIINLTKLYAPAVIIEGLSVASILTGNKMWKKRNIALAAAYATIDQSFRDYRGRVVEKYGEDVDNELRYGIKKETIEEITVDENGKKKKVKKTIDVIDGMPSAYARYFTRDEAKAAEDSMVYNLTFLKYEMQLANRILVATGKVYLNDIYDRLGIKRSKAGQVVGWVYDPKNPTGDNKIIFDTHTVYRRNPDSPNGFEKVLLIDFNVDGVITDVCLEKGLITE